MEQEIRTLAALTCPSLSGRSDLTYEYGVQGDDQLQIRITGNTGGGMFAKDWFPLSEVIQVLRSAEVTEGISATVFRALFGGKSINTQSFLMAILLAEGAVRAHSVKPRGYEVGDVDALVEKVRVLLGAPVDIVAEPSSATKKPSRKKASPPVPE